MNKTITIILTFLVSTALFAVTDYGTLIVKQVNSVYDGDTFRCDISDVHPALGKNIGIRVYGVDTPELKDKRPNIYAIALEAKQFLSFMLNNAEVIELRDVKRGKYFRLVADVYVDGNSVSNELIMAGLAKPYFGKTKTKW